MKKISNHFVIFKLRTFVQSILNELIKTGSCISYNLNKSKILFLALFNFYIVNLSDIITSFTF